MGETTRTRSYHFPLCSMLLLFQTTPIICPSPHLSSGVSHSLAVTLHSTACCSLCIPAFILPDCNILFCSLWLIFYLCQKVQSCCCFLQKANRFQADITFKSLNTQAGWGTVIIWTATGMKASHVSWALNLVVHRNSSRDWWISL